VALSAASFVEKLGSFSQITTRPILTASALAAFEDAPLVRKGGEIGFVSRKKSQPVVLTASALMAFEDANLVRHHFRQ
jgi:hypothetical protein